MHDSLYCATVLRVLVAEKQEDSRLSLCDRVRQAGHEAVGVGNGVEAVDIILQTAPDLVLLDVLLPDMGAYAVHLTQRSQPLGRWVPVIVTCSLEDEAHALEALRQGADDYLVQPVHPALLEVKLRHYARVLGLQSRVNTLAQRQRDIHDHILDAVIILDDAGYVSESNRAAERIFGVPGAGLDGLPCEQVLGASLTELLAAREISLTRANGVAFPAELVISQWTEAARLRFTIVIRDLTERHRIDRMKDEFLATVSHELRTPLSSVLGALGLLASGAAGELPKAAIPLAEVAKRNGEQLSRLIDDILDLTKLEGNQMVLQTRPTRLDALLGEAIAANQAYAQRKGVALRLETSPGSPQVRIDAHRLLQVMANLLSNAVKHSRAGDTVTVGVDWTPMQVRVSVRDLGPGIDPPFRAHLFEKFSQADASDRRAQGGTGLGLYITRMLVERMGGRIGVESVVGQGATFVLEFPVVGAFAPVSALQLLYIDRDLDAQRRVADWLSALCPVAGAADLQEAQGLLAQRQCPVIMGRSASAGISTRILCARAKDGSGTLHHFVQRCPGRKFREQHGTSVAAKSAYRR